MPGNHPDQSRERTLIVRLDHLGDVLLTTPLIRAAVKSGADVHLLLHANCATLFASNPAVTVHKIEDVAPGFPGKWWTLGAWMRAQKFDLILLPYAKPKQLLLASAMSGAKRRIAMWAGILGRLTLHHCLRSGMHEATRHFSEIPLDCAAAAGFSTDGLRPDFPLDAAEIESARSDFTTRFPGLKIIGIHPGCAGNTCNLPPQVFAEVAAQLLEHPDIAVVATGIPAERKLLDTWPDAVLRHPRFYNACGEWTLRQLAAHIANYTTALIPSTGPLHIAAAYGVPTVSAFCVWPSVSARVWGNLTPGSVVVSPPGVFCEAQRAATHTHCDFKGQIRAEQLTAPLLQIAAARGIPNFH